MKPRIVLSAVNFVEGGPLAIFQDALRALAGAFHERYEIVALVHRRELFDVEYVTFLAFPSVRQSWLARLRFEYWDCRALSHQLRPHLWLAMHDISPVVDAGRQAVYCHNPAPFYKLSLRAAWADKRFALFVWLYRFLYRIHLQRNEFIIVQQQWLREEFSRYFPANKIIVAHPRPEQLAIAGGLKAPGARFCFIYPALARSFKNLEAILEAVALLESRDVNTFEVLLTVDGTENAYARKLRGRFGALRSVQWLGLLPRERVLALYGKADCLLFPSMLETWGLPLSEFGQTRKPILAADLPYAHETIGTYDTVRFFAPENHGELAHCMQEAAAGSLKWNHAVAAPIPAPFAANWQELFELLLGQESPG